MRGKLPASIIAGGLGEGREPRRWRWGRRRRGETKGGFKGWSEETEFVGIEESTVDEEKLRELRESRENEEQERAKESEIGWASSKALLLLQMDEGFFCMSGLNLFEDLCLGSSTSAKWGKQLWEAPEWGWIENEEENEAEDEEEEIPDREKEGGTRKGNELRRESKQGQLHTEQPSEEVEEEERAIEESEGVKGNGIESAEKGEVERRGEEKAGGKVEKISWAEDKALADCDNAEEETEEKDEDKEWLENEEKVVAIEQQQEDDDNEKNDEETDWENAVTLDGWEKEEESGRREGRKSLTEIEDEERG